MQGAGGLGYGWGKGGENVPGGGAPPQGGPVIGPQVVHVAVFAFGGFAQGPEAVEHFGEVPAGDVDGLGLGAFIQAQGLQALEAGGVFPLEMGPLHSGAGFLPLGGG